MILLFAIINAVFFGLFFLLFAIPAIWLAFGRTHIFLRLPVFLLCSLALGLVLVFSEWNSNALFLYLGGVTFIAMSLPRTVLLFQVILLLLGTLMLVSLQYQIDLANADSALIVRVTLAMTVVAGLLATLRLFSFRLVNITDGVTGVEIEQGTGGDLDGCRRMLDAENAQTLNHAEIMAYLRQYGFSFDWQRTLTVAYERTLGRWTIGQTADGKQQIVMPDSSGDFDNGLAAAQQRFTIRQLLLLTFCAACFLGFGRSFSWSLPTVLELRYGLPGTLGLGVITSALLWGCLAVRDARRRVRHALLVTLGAAVVVLYVMPPNPLSFLVLPIACGYAVLLILALVLFRQRGYRLVRVQAARPLY
jgi:hypothetical protein